VALAERGYALALVSRSAETLEETVAAAAGEGTRVETLVADVGDPAQLEPLLPLLERLPSLHAVVNNAGMGIWRPIEEMTDEEWEVQLRTNLTGSFNVVRATVPLFDRRGRGLYVNIASDCALVGMKERAAYNASKFGLVGLTATMRAELAERGIATSVVFAGKTDTYFRGRQPGDRPGALEASEVAETVAFVVDRFPQALVSEIAVFPPGEYLTGPRSLV
jgi:NAD(P)-dependent dehydrogenase (short-subunit alcohol dehydrogenase family)